MMQMTDMPIAMMWGMGVIWLLILILLVSRDCRLDQASPLVRIGPKLKIAVQPGEPDHKPVSA